MPLGPVRFCVFVLQPPILGTRFVAPSGHTLRVHHLRATALRVFICGYKTILPLSPCLSVSKNPVRSR